METDVRFIRSAFNKLGFLVNVQKSSLTPTQRIEFIGAVLDSNQARSYLPDSSIFL